MKTVDKKQDIFLRVALAASLFLVTFLIFFIYSFSLNGDFIWDDHILIKANDQVKGASAIKDVFAHHWGEGAGIPSHFYRPLVTLSFMLDYKLWGLNPCGYHMVNIFVHILVVLLLFWLIRYFTSDTAALIAILIYAVIPANVEAVANIGARTEMLSTVFLVLAAGFYTRYCEQGRGVYYIAGIVSFALGLFAKETVLIFIPLACLYHLCFWQKPRAGTIAFLLAAAAYFILRRQIFAGYSFPFSFMPSGGIAHWALMLFTAFFGYLKIIFWPFGLHIEYMDQPLGWHDIRPYLGILFFIAIIISGVIALKHKRRAMAFGIFWFVFCIVPFCGIYPLPFYKADHYLYFPLAGAVLALACALDHLIYNVRAGRIAVYCAALLVIFYSAVSIKQNAYWADAIDFYKTTLN